MTSEQGEGGGAKGFLKLSLIYDFIYAMHTTERGDSG